MYPTVTIGPLHFYSFGLVFGFAICVGWLAFGRYFKRQGVPVRLPLLGALVICSGFAGAKLDYSTVSALLTRHDSTAFASQMKDLSGGYTYLGCVLAGSFASLFYFRLTHIPLLVGLDSLFCIGPAYAVGRIGCFLAGDGDYGIPSTLPWAISFPHGIFPTTLRVHPTMLYLSAWEFTLFALLWHLSARHRKIPLPPGTLLGFYLIASGAGRFLVEFLSRNPVIAFGLKEAQLVSAVMIAWGGLMLMRISPSTSEFRSPRVLVRKRLFGLPEA